MYDYIYRKELILSSLWNGLKNKGYSFKELAGINGRLNLTRDIKNRYNYDTLNKLTELTNYPIIDQIIHGLDNASFIDKEKFSWYVIGIDIKDINKENRDVISKSFLDKNTLVYTSKKNISGTFVNFIVIFSRNRYNDSCEYINSKWQRR